MNVVKALPKNEAKAETKPGVKTVKPTENLQNATETKPTEEEAKQEVKALLEKYKPEPPKCAEDRIQRSKQFEALSTRFQQLKDKSNELQTFKAGNDKLNAKVIFKNAQGFEFSVQNSNVIGKLLEAGEKELAILLAEADNEVMTFEI
jgi:hypothetical protein